MTFKFQKFSIKNLVLFKIHLNYLKDNFFECFFKKYNRLLIFLKKIFFFIIYNNEKKNEEKLEEEKIIKDIRNLLRLKKEQNYNAIKGIRTFLDKEKET